MDSDCRGHCSEHCRHRGGDSDSHGAFNAAPAERQRMSGGVRDVWVYLAATPLLWLTFTLAAYLAGMWIYGGLKLNPLANPVLIAIVIVVAVLISTDTSYDTYFEG